MVYKIRDDVDLNILVEKYKFEHIPGYINRYYKVYYPKFLGIPRVSSRKVRGLSIDAETRIITIKKAENCFMICDWVTADDDIFAIKDLIKNGLVETVDGKPVNIYK